MPRQAVLLKAPKEGSSHHGSEEMNLTSIHEDTGLISDHNQWVKSQVLLCLWCRLAATAPVQPLAWEPPCAADVALQRQKKKKVPKEILRLCQVWERPSPLTIKQ